MILPRHYEDVEASGIRTRAKRMGQGDCTVEKEEKGPFTMNELKGTSFRAAEREEDGLLKKVSQKKGQSSSRM